MDNIEAKFKVGDIVALNADHSRKGPVIEILPEVQGIPRYKVFHSSDDIGEYLEIQISLSSLRSVHVIDDKPLGPKSLK